MIQHLMLPVMNSKSFTFPCPACRNLWSASVTEVGRDTVCPTCSTPFKVPESTEAPQPSGSAVSIPRRGPPIHPVRTSPSNQALIPNHSGRILFLGLLAWLIGILGLMALGQGMDDIQKIEKGEMKPDGKGLIIFGMVSGVLGLLTNLCLIISQCSRGTL